MSTEYTATLSLTIPNGLRADAVRIHLHRITDAIESMLAYPEDRQRKHCEAIWTESVQTLQTLAKAAALARQEGQA